MPITDILIVRVSVGVFHERIMLIASKATMARKPPTAMNDTLEVDHLAKSFPMTAVKQISQAIEPITILEITLGSTPSDC